MSTNLYIEHHSRQKTSNTIEEYLVDFLSNVHVDKLIDYANLEREPDTDAIRMMERELERMTVRIQESIEEGEFSE